MHLRARNLLRKLSISALAVGVSISIVPWGASASSVPSKLFADSLSLNSTTEKPLIDSRINLNSSKKIKVIVQLSGQPAAVGKYAAKMGITSLAKSASVEAVNKQQATVLDEAADQNLDLQVNYKYDTVLNGFEVTIPADQISKLAAIPGVKSVYKNSTWYPVPDDEDSSEPSSPENDNAPINQIHADWAWAHNYTGAGYKVGVIDTGVDYTHPDIKAAYKGGYDSFYQDNDPYEEVPLTKEEDPYHVGYEGTYHGTHVAGTIVGQFANRTGDVAQKGIAYGAELYVYKVLGRNLEDPSTSSGSSAQVIDGIERAVKAKMDVINLSLGSDSEKDVNSPDAIAINNAVLSGVVAVIANGNAGPDYFTMGSPATAQLGIAVGAATSPSKHFEGDFKAELAESPESVTTVTYDTYHFNVMGWRTGAEDFAGQLGNEPFDVAYVGLGADNDYDSSIDYSDKIVLASRGAYAFVDKIAAAKAHGAKAIVIFNGDASKDDPTQPNLSPIIPGRDDFYGGSLGDSFEFIPAFDLKGSEGRALARTLQENPGAHFKFTFDSDYDSSELPGDELADFSSWGPNVDPDMSIKPDFVAPGYNILSTWPAYGKDKEGVSYAEAYNRISGTSMATPHVAGLALLIKQAHPTWSPLDIRSALANTADELEDYDVYQQGAGRVNVENAIKTSALLQSIEPITILDKNFQPQNVINYNSSASFGVVQPGASAVKNLQLKNTGSEDLTYTATVDWHGDGNHDGVEVSLDTNSVSAAAGKTTPFALNLAVSSVAEKESTFEGQVTLTAPGQPELHLPFVVSIGDELPATGFGIQEMALSNSIIYPNRSAQTTTDLSFKLTEDDANYYEVDLVNLDDEVIGYYEIQGTDSADQFFEPGVYSLKNISAAYHPYDEDGYPILDDKDQPATEYLKDGIYKIMVNATRLDSAGYPIRDKNGNLVVNYMGFKSFRVDNSVPSTGGGGGGIGSTAPSTPTPSPAPSITISGAGQTVIEQGYKQITVKTVIVTSGEVTVLTVSDADLDAALGARDNSKAALILSAPGSSEKQVNVVLTAGQVKKLSGLSAKDAVVVDVNGNAVSLPAALFTSSPAGAGFTLAFAQADDQKATFSKIYPQAEVLGTPVSIEASWSTNAGSKAVEIPNDQFIKRTFTVQGNLTPNSAGVLFEENDAVTPVASVFKPQQDGTTLVTVTRPGFSTYAVVTRPAAFKDIASSPAASDIQALANKLIIEGTTSTTFSPKANLTRAEFTALLTRALGLRANSGSSFTDVNSAAWYASSVNAASEAGLIKGTGNGKFNPNALVTRQELAVMLDRALKLTGIEITSSNPSFHTYTDDALIAGFAKESVQDLAEIGVVDSGSAAAAFNPAVPATRETAAMLLHQLLSKAGLLD